MRQHTENQAVVEAAGTTIKEFLDNLGKKFPDIASRIFENGQVRRFVNIYLNDEDIRYLDNLQSPVKDGDEAEHHSRRGRRLTWRTPAKSTGPDE